MPRPLRWLIVQTALRAAIPLLASGPGLAQTGGPAAPAPGAEASAPVPTGRATLEPGAAWKRAEGPDPVDGRIAEVDALLARAHFRTALGVARTSLARLDALGPAPHPDARRARLELLAATAEVALGRREAARQSLIRALSADPGLALDAGETSPKLLELLREARLRTGIEEPKP